MRVCFSCRKELPYESFAKDSQRTDGAQRECRHCCAARKSAWNKTEAGKRSAAATKLRQRFGLTLEDYERMYEEQAGKCLTCDSSESHRGHRLAVDHCHTTGKVRGLLCKSCNVALGNARENPNILRRLAEYAEERCTLEEMKIDS